MATARLTAPGVLLGAIANCTFAAPAPAPVHAHSVIQFASDRTPDPWVIAVGGLALIALSLVTRRWTGREQ